jgi:DNA-binding transcriptional LysR family regulator
MPDLKQLRVLRAVAEAGSFSAAAEGLNYTQPAVSRIVAALERELAPPCSWNATAGPSA